MVKVVFAIFFFFALSFSDVIKAQETSIKSDHEMLDLKIKSLLPKRVYQDNKSYIDTILFSKSSYITDSRVDVLKVIRKLKNDGLLELYFDKPSELRLNFHTSDNPLFFVKIMSDTLRNMGYYRYITKESKLDETGFTWSITLKAEYVIDPQILQNELSSNGSGIVDITRVTLKEWTFDIDMRDAYLDVKVLQDEQEIELQRSLYSYWLDVSMIKQLKISSSKRNSWYPYITYFDNSLHLLKVVKVDSRRTKILLNIPQSAKYIKISDIYTLKNIKDTLLLMPIGSR
ncbi:MAG: hypothetical protein L3I99_02610 [Sulfurimonas sp.]|nr:hypothetical protein [Sulfurimonas sp.]